MTAAALDQAAAWLTLPLMALALAAGAAAALARTLLAFALGASVAAMCAAASILALGEADAALALAAAAIWIPVLLIVGTSLGGRVAKSSQRRRPWLGAAAIFMLAATLTWTARGQAGLATDIVASIVRGGGSIGPWLAALMLVAAAACVALLGYGERGALRSSDGARRVE